MDTSYFYNNDKFGHFSKKGNFIWKNILFCKTSKTLKSYWTIEMDSESMGSKFKHELSLRISSLSLVFEKMAKTIEFVIDNFSSHLANHQNQIFRCRIHRTGWTV
jgi:hypothetical protein